MKFDLKISEKPNSSSWAVELWAENGNVPELIGGYELEAVQDGNLILPLPPAQNRVVLPANYEDLWNNTARLLSFFRSFFRQGGQNSQQLEAAGSYLFACLPGPILWQEIETRATNQKIELRLDIADSNLARLPWELIRGQAELKFLLSNSQVNLYRVVGVAQPNILPALELPLKVLFVIAAELTDPEINAASEYLGLIRRLQEGKEGLPLDITLLSTLAGPQTSTFEAMQRAIERVQPHVLHLVAHGGLDAGQAFLEFPVENQGEDGRKDATNLEQALVGQGLRAVVLNACYGGQSPSLPGTNGSSNPGLPYTEEATRQNQAINSSLAARLVQAGIPFVVGMNGRVADQVCRLFAREFYVGLARGQSVAEACARGRHAGLAGQYRAEQKLDWALPVLFKAQNGPEQLEIRPQAPTQDLNQLARQVIRPSRPDFCDRLTFLQAFKALLVAGPVRQSAMALYTTGPEGRGLGKTRLLQEMGKLAVQAGHFACVIPAEEKIDFKSYLTRTVAPYIEEAAAYWFKREFSLRQLDLTLKALDNATNEAAFNPELTDRVRNLLRRGSDTQIERRALVTALGQDVVNLADKLGQDKLVVLLFDDVDTIGTALPDFHDVLLEKGLYSVSERVRVVFAFDSSPGDRRDAAQTLYQYAQQSQWINLLPVTPFPADEESLAYRQYLLQHSPPLVDLSTHNEFFSLFKREAAGRPDRLLGTEKVVIPYFLEDLKILALANDQELLAQVAISG